MSWTIHSSDQTPTNSLEGITGHRIFYVQTVCPCQLYIQYTAAILYAITDGVEELERMLNTHMDH